MSALDDQLSLSDADRTLSMLTSYLEGFIAVWESEDAPPDVREFLPPPGEQRKLVLAELLKIDLEYRWLELDLPKTLTDYLREFPELGEGGIPADLVYEEFHIRRQAGDEVQPQDYFKQFPNQVSELRCLLEIGTPYEPTSVSKSLPKDQLKMISVGQRLDEFDLLAVLGEGAFAKVFLARQNSMQRLVALKVSADRGTEPQTLAQMDHDHIVRVYDLRVVNTPAVRLLYMQYVPGGTLQQVIKQLENTPGEQWSGKVLLQAVDQALEKRGESRPVESSIRERIRRSSWPHTVAWIGSRLAHALHYAHRIGILHRDVKPANVLVSAEGIPKLADFNISFSSKVEGATPAAYFGGSLAYMSPEQLEACNPTHERSPESLDGRSDLYSLGVMIWELLAGDRPFEDEKVSTSWAKTLSAMTERRRNLEFQNLMVEGETRPETQGLLRVLKVCLDPDPDQRWQTGNELAKQLVLTTKPHAQELLYPPRKSWANRLRAWPWTMIIVLLIAPNILAGVFNFFYNKSEIIASLGGENADQIFWQIQFVINTIAYPLGVWFAWRIGRPVVNELKSGSRAPAEPEVRRRSLYLGHYLALVAVTEWTVAGMVYPISVQMTSGRMTAYGAAHFFGSLLACGLVAAAYPFFLLTVYSMRVLYPALVHGNITLEEDIPHLRQLQKWSGRYMVSAVAVPLGTLFILLMMQTKARFALIILCATAGVGVALLISKLIPMLQRDTNTLIEAFQPESD